MTPVRAAAMSGTEIVELDHWGVVPDLITIAKGLTSTYNSHPLACAAALAAIKVYEDESLIGNAARLGGLLSQHLAETESRHPSVGATRSIGLFGLVELVRSRTPYTPLASFNGTSDEMTALARALREQGLYTFVRGNTFFTTPPLVITESQLDEAFGVIDRALLVTDRAVAA